MAIRKPSLRAVLTGDIVNSTKLSSEQAASLIRQISGVLKSFFAYTQHEFFRGDSFQVYLKHPIEALRMALVCRALAIKVAGQGDERQAIKSDVRISIGVGTVSGGVKNLGSARGEAFLLSGRHFDQLKEKRRLLSISCNDAIANVGFEMMTNYLDSIYDEMTAIQANVIVLLLQGITQQELAFTQNKSKSTISEIASAARWPEIENILKQYENLINLILK